MQLAIGAYYPLPFFMCITLVFFLLLMLYNLVGHTQMPMGAIKSINMAIPHVFQVHCVK
jgi:hypothetical protein